MKKWGNLNLIHMDDRELKTSLGTGNFIFVGSSNDMWAERVPDIWIRTILEHINKYNDNKYMFQSKNPIRFLEFCNHLPEKCHIGTTIETNRVYPCMGGKLPPVHPENRAMAIMLAGHKLEMGTMDRFITIEPILDFDLDPFLTILKEAEPDYINIGADSGGNGLPEPPGVKVIELIDRLEHIGITVYRKANLDRLFKPPKVKKHHLADKDLIPSRSVIA
jgi:hypothetical protein